MCEKSAAVLSYDVHGKPGRPSVTVEYGDESGFPNLRIALQIKLTMALAVACCERSSSKLKLITSYIRASTSHTRFYGLL